jgi:hypothetical protein
MTRHVTTDTSWAFHAELVISLRLRKITLFVMCSYAQAQANNSNYFDETIPSKPLPDFELRSKSRRFPARNNY